MIEKCEVRVLSPEEYGEWDELVASSIQGSLFSTTLWMRGMREVTGKEFRIYGCYDKGKLLGGVALQVFNKGPFSVGTMPKLTPFTGFIIAPQETHKLSNQELTRKTIMDSLSDRLRNDLSWVFFANHPSLRDLRPLKWKGWSVGVNHTYYVDLTDMERLWNSVDRNVRTQIRKAEALGMRVVAGEDISLFYKIYRETFSHKGLPVPARQETVRQVYSLLREQGLAKLYLGEDSSGKAVSAYICIWDSRRGYFWVGGTEPESRSTQITTLVYWSILKDMSGFLPAVDLSGGNTPAIARFQRDFASSLEPYYQVEHSSLGARVAQNLYARVRRRTG